MSAGNDVTQSGDGLAMPEIESASAAVSDALRRLQRRWPPAVALETASHASIYHSYPYLFLAAFPSLPAARVESLCLAASLFAESLFVADDLMDGDGTDRDVTTNVLCLQAMQLEGYRVLHSLFPPRAGFWDRFQGYLAAYAQACLDERRFAVPGAGWEDLTEAAALGIAQGKSSFAKFVVAGLAELAGDDEPLVPLCRALDSYYLARQMMDDLTDWRQDLARGYPSLLLKRVLDQQAGARREELARQPESTGKAIYAGGHARHVLELALRAFHEAEDLTGPYPGLLFRGVAAKLAARCRSLLDRLGQLSAPAEARPGARRWELTLPSPEDAWQELAWPALGSLLRRWQPAPSDPAAASRGEELRHRRAAPGGDVLVRALVADALCDADESLDGRLRPLLEGEADHLILDRLSPGGWGWPGLPADADHLGCVLRVLARLGRSRDLEEHGESPLASLLAGETDPDVLARLLSALRLWDPVRFSPVLAGGASWIEARQKADGSWESRGVNGVFLPVATCAGLLATERPGSPALRKAAAFLRGAQNADGGWGTVPGRSDSLSTALALLGLVRLQDAAGDEMDRERARRGRELLAARVRFEAPALPGGLTLTAAFALQAALAWHRLERDAADIADIAEARPAEPACEVAS